MSFSFIEKSNIKDAYTESQEYMRPLFEPFDEYERLARNKPHPKIPAHLPKVTEGTLSSTIIKQPRRVIMQMPTGVVKVEGDEGGLSPVLQVLLDSVYIPNAKTGGDVLQKGWQSTQNTLTYGSQPILSFYTRHGKYMGADMRLPYIKDVYLEKNQLASANSSNIEFMDSWYTKSMVKSIVETEKWLIGQAKLRNEVYKSTWDLKLLSDLLNDGEQAKSEDQQTPGERERGGEAGGYLISTGFQDGIGAEFYSFLPGKEDKFVRTKVNPDPRGKMPLTHQYHTVDGGNPLGRGAPEHSGPMQNMVDSYLQMSQYNWALRNAPPIKKWGDLDNSKIKFQPDWIIEMGAKGTSDIEAVQIAPQASQDFANNFGLLKSILVTGANAKDTSISAESGATGFSKTSAGVKDQQSILGVDDNYIRRQYESAWAEVFETGINIQIAEGKGREPLVLEEEQIEKLASIYPQVRENGGRLDVIYDAITTEVTFKIDTGTSAGEDNDNQTEILTSLINTYSENETLQSRLDQENYDFSIGEAFDRVVKKSGVQDPEKIIHKLSEEEIAQKEAEAEALAAQQAAAMGEQLPDQTETSVEDIQPHDPMSDLDRSPLEGMGLTPEQQDTVIAMLQDPNVDPEAVLDGIEDMSAASQGGI